MTWMKNIKWTIWHLSHINIMLGAHCHYSTHHWWNRFLSISDDDLAWKIYDFTQPSVITHTQDAWPHTMSWDRRGTDQNSGDLAPLALIKMVKQSTGDPREKKKEKKTSINDKHPQSWILTNRNWHLFHICSLQMILYPFFLFKS